MKLDHDPADALRLSALRRGGCVGWISAAHPPSPLRFLAALLLLCLAGCRDETVLSHGRFEKVHVYRTQGTPDNVALLFSDQHWSAREKKIARALADHHTLVIGIDTQAFLQVLEADGGDCTFPDGDLDNLSRYLQAYYKLPTVHAPTLTGIGAGAALAYAVLAQSPPQVFTAALGLSFCPQLALKRPICAGDGLKTQPANGGLQLLPTADLKSPFVVLRGDRDASCTLATTQAFVRQIPSASLHVMADTDGHSRPRKWLPTLLQQYAVLAANDRETAPPPPPPGLEDLPIIEVPAAHDRGDSFAILLSGDGGWAGIDKDIAEDLAARGIPVVGVDALRYFWGRRDPQGTAKDIDRLIRYYTEAWKKSRVMLIGFSQGADVLPFVLNRLPQQTRRKVALTATLSLARQAAFEFHLSNWVGSSGDHPTRPELDRLADTGLLCVYGTDDEDAICPDLDPKRYQLVKLPGGHHFDGDYDKLAEVILGALPPLSP